MNDKRIKYIGLLILPAFLLSSCTQEIPTVRDVTADDSEILFFTSLPGVQTRSNDNIDKNSIKNGFDVSAACLDGDLPTEYFSTQLVKQTEGMGEAFRSNSCRWPSNKGTNAGKLRFFAFFPSQEVLRNHAGVDQNNNNYFKLEYTKTENGAIEYWMKRFKVNEDINVHTDFVTATVEGSKTDNLYSGVNLKFQHQLSKITLEAFGNSDSYDVEIAGVRIGGLALESDFSFEGKPLRVFDYTLTRIGRWTGTNQTKGCVEYIFREGDTVIPIGKGSHGTKGESVSIMGKGGPALVIPYDYYVWEYKKGYNKTQSPLYFSVLLRVKEKLIGNNTLLYPYIEGANISSSATTDKMNVVYLSVERESGKVTKRVYKKGKDFFTSPDCSAASLYSVPTTEEVRNYGWASAIPSTGGDPQIRWNPGFQYFYQLDYSKGIGVQDPADMYPGQAIIYPVEVTGTSILWHTVGDFEKKELDLKVQE